MKIVKKIFYIGIIAAVLSIGTYIGNESKSIAGNVDPGGGGGMRVITEKTTL